MLVRTCICNTDFPAYTSRHLACKTATHILHSVVRRREEAERGSVTVEYRHTDSATCVYFSASVRSFRFLLRAPDGRADPKSELVSQDTRRFSIRSFVRVKSIEKERTKRRRRRRKIKEEATTKREERETERTKEEREDREEESVARKR